MSDWRQQLAGALQLLRTRADKERLQPALSAGNPRESMTLAVTAIIGDDLDSRDHLPPLFPRAKARSFLIGSDAVIRTTAFRNGTLQGAYLIIAARALGFDCGPMPGFDAAKLDPEFFPKGTVRTNFPCNLGYGDSAKRFACGPRRALDEACRLA